MHKIDGCCRMDASTCIALRDIDVECLFSRPAERSMSPNPPMLAFENRKAPAWRLLLLT